MARVFPYETSRTSIRVPSFGRFNPSNAQIPGVDLQPVADTAAKIAQVMKARNDQVVFNNKDIQGREGLTEAFLAASQQSDPSKVVQTYNEMEDEVISSALEDVGGQVQSQLSDSLRRQSLSNKARLQEIVLKRQGEQVEMSRELRNQELVKAWANSPSEAERKSLGADIAAGFNNDPLMTPEEKELRIAQTMGRAQVERGLALVNNRDYAGAEEFLLNAEDIGEEERLKLLKITQQAQASEILQDERIERKNDRIRGEQQEAVTLGALEAIFSGELAEDQLLQLARDREINPSQLLTLKNALDRESSPETVSSDPSAYAYSLSLIDQKDPSALQSILDNPSLSNTDKKGLIDDYRRASNSGNDPMAATERQLTKDLRKLMKARSGDLSLGSLSPVENALDEVNAVREFQSKLRTLQDKGEPFDPNEVFDQVAKKYLQPSQIGVLTIPPNVGNSSSLELTTLFQEAEAKLGAEINGGKMTKEQASKFLAQFKASVIDQVRAAKVAE